MIAALVLAWATWSPRKRMSSEIQCRRCSSPSRRRSSILVAGSRCQSPNSVERSASMIETGRIRAVGVATLPPANFFDVHGDIPFRSAASLCASAICAAVIFFATSSRLRTALSRSSFFMAEPDAAILNDTCAWTKLRGTPCPLAYMAPRSFCALASPWSAALRNSFAASLWLCRTPSPPK